MAEEGKANQVPPTTPEAKMPPPASNGATQSPAVLMGSYPGPSMKVGDRSMPMVPQLSYGRSSKPAKSNRSGEILLGVAPPKGD